MRVKRLYPKDIGSLLATTEVVDVATQLSIERVEGPVNYNYIIHMQDGQQITTAGNSLITCVLQARGGRLDAGAFRTELVGLLENDPAQAATLLADAVCHMGLLLADEDQPSLEEIPILRETILMVKDCLEGKGSLSVMKLHEYIMKRHGDSIHRW